MLTKYIGGPKILAWPRLHRRFTWVRHSCKQQGALQITEVWKNRGRFCKIVRQKLKQGIKRLTLFFADLQRFWPEVLKGELKRFFVSAQSFYRPQTKTSFKRQFSPKSPKVGQKSGQTVKNWPNKNQVASDLLRESTDSVIRSAEGIHQFCPPTY